MSWYTEVMNHAPVVWHYNYNPRHGGAGYAQSGAASLRIGADAHPSVTLCNADETGMLHTAHLSLLPDRAHVRVNGEAQEFPDPPPHDRSHTLRTLIEAHHEGGGTSWPAVLDELVSHPDFGHMFVPHVEAHTHSRIT